MKPARLLTLLLGCGLAAVSLDARAQSYAACGAGSATWSIGDAPEDFFGEAAQFAETNAAAEYEALASRGVAAAENYQRAAIASERAIGDLAAAAALMEARGELRSARNARRLKAQHRERADRNWQLVEGLGSSAVPGESTRSFACDGVPDGDAADLRQQARQRFDAAEKLIESRLAQASGAGAVEKDSRLFDRIAAEVRQGADSLVIAACNGDSGTQIDLLDAATCYASLVGSRQVTDPTFEADTYVKIATVFRTLAVLGMAEEALGLPPP